VLLVSAGSSIIFDEALTSSYIILVRADLVLDDFLTRERLIDLATAIEVWIQPFKSNSFNLCFRC